MEKINAKVKKNIKTIHSIHFCEILKTLNLLVNEWILISLLVNFFVKLIHEPTLYDFKVVSSIIIILIYLL